ncbi:hypothetical protein [Blastococcus brunescens]|uniref:Uncharacterized protein n=1 Tax=Blastococcus brunescens TaxID=1564165 RepID=A0ABZ1B1N9_9ACTN|nr:hypothetical protein [Blastococcus sp. BMG 8361]WRL64277.1 hypothetical protein U6N30_32840 [Blastococcus sp. BMG 8361]
MIDPVLLGCWENPDLFVEGVHLTVDDYAQFAVLLARAHGLTAVGPDPGRPLPCGCLEAAPLGCLHGPPRSSWLRRDQPR